MDMELFAKMFDEYCLSESAKGHCDDDDCFRCPVNMAWHRIFDED